MRLQKILGLAAVLVLIGAGCDSPTQKTEDNEDKPAIEQQEDGQMNEEATDEMNGEEGTEENMESEDSKESDDSSMEEDEKSDEEKESMENEDESENDGEFSIDDTWQTYTSRSKDWQFNWPTKGLYAPMWEVTFESDDDLDDGCVKGESEKVTVSGIEFCHTQKLSDGTSYDYFVTKLGGTNIVLNFTKDTDQYKSFDMEDYQKSLRQVVSTFKKLN